MLPPGSNLIYTQPSEAFSLHIQIALDCRRRARRAVHHASGVALHRAWLVREREEVRDSLRRALDAWLIGGAAFNHYVAFPFMIAFFATFNSPDLHFMPALSPVWSMYTKFLIAMAITFQMPTVVFFLARMKLVTARFLLKHLKYAILIIFIVAALVTPGGDPGTQAVFAAPMLVLYLFSIAIAWIVAPRGSEKTE